MRRLLEASPILGRAPNAEELEDEGEEGAVEASDQLDRHDDPRTNGEHSSGELLNLVDVLLQLDVVESVWSLAQVQNDDQSDRISNDEQVVGASAELLLLRSTRTRSEPLPLTHRATGA